LERFIALHRTDAIPDGAAYELRDLARRLGFLEEAARKEAMRILCRKEAQRGLQPIARNVLEELRELINRQQVPIAELADELIIGREFAAAQDQAKTPLMI
jgi:CRISPR-associated protein Cmr2